MRHMCARVCCAVVMLGAINYAMQYRIAVINNNTGWQICLAENNAYIVHAVLESGGLPVASNV